MGLNLEKMMQKLTGTSDGKFSGKVAVIIGGAGMVPMKRWGKPEEIARAVLFLAFDATFTTGIPVDGGWSQL